ncbi:16S rRNA (guanine(527)-N(7))-methyltransferase RsmG [bacterium]|nr:16S rRNA (guanine(527)-N(7))-methyltransferase RsmG [bacterium]
MPDKAVFKKYMKLFLEENQKLNLISKNDEQFLWEKHVCDSLSMELFFEKYSKPETILDFGTGGGFPSVPLALAYPDIKITALDSIAKKIRAVELFKSNLGIDNLDVVCSRVENYQGQFDVVTSRAVSSLKNIIEYAIPKLKCGGYFVAYKSRKSSEEIAQSLPVLKKYKAKIVDIIDYKLPLDEDHTRNLIIIKSIK